MGLAFLALDGLTAGLLAEVPAEGAFGEAATRGRQFLESLFDPRLDLLPEYRGAKVYWLFHDNYLASKVLAGSNPGISNRISDAIHRFGVDHSGKIEILFGEARQPLPFRQYELAELARTGGMIVKTERVTREILQGWQDYADLLFLAAIAESDPHKAAKHFDNGLILWDGTGFKDRVVEKSQRYATYKLALSQIAAAKLNLNPKSAPAILRQLLTLQAKDGGWITDYDPKGNPVGSANVETTCVAILGLEAAMKRNRRNGRAQDG